MKLTPGFQSSCSIILLVLTLPCLTKVSMSKMRRSVVDKFKNWFSIPFFEFDVARKFVVLHVIAFMQKSFLIHLIKQLHQRRLLFGRRRRECN